MRILQAATFRRSVKKLHSNQKSDLDEAIKVIVATPSCGKAKMGDLAGISIYKFNMVNQLTLLAYIYSTRPATLTFLALGTHESFYRNIKRLT